MIIFPARAAGLTILFWFHSAATPGPRCFPALCHCFINEQMHQKSLVISTVKVQWLNHLLSQLSFSDV